MRVRRIVPSCFPLVMAAALDSALSMLVYARQEFHPERAQQALPPEGGFVGTF